MFNWWNDINNVINDSIWFKKINLIQSISKFWFRVRYNWLEIEIDSRIRIELNKLMKNDNILTIIFFNLLKKSWFSFISWNFMIISFSFRSHSYSSDLTEFILFRRGTLKCALRIPRHQKSNLLNQIEFCFDFKILCLPLQDSSVRRLRLANSVTWSFSQLGVSLDLEFFSTWSFSRFEILSTSSFSFELDLAWYYQCLQFNDRICSI